MLRWCYILVVMLILTGCSAASPSDDRMAIEAIVIETSGNQTTATVTGYLLDTCTQIDRVDQLHAGMSITLTLILNQPNSIYCPKLFAPFDQPVTLDTTQMSPGTYTVTTGGETASFTIDGD